MPVNLHEVLQCFCLHLTLHESPLFAHIEKIEDLAPSALRCAGQV
jgi:hypothetical protein